VIENETSIIFSVNLKKRPGITAEVEGIRLGVTLFDPVHRDHYTNRLNWRPAMTVRWASDPFVSSSRPRKARISFSFASGVWRDKSVFIACTWHFSAAQDGLSDGG